MSDNQSGYGELLRLGAVVAMIVAALIAAAVVLYFIWPYAIGRLTTPEILQYLHDEPFAALVSLDLSMMILGPINIIVFIAFYVTLRRESPSWALVALVFGILAIPMVITARPLFELLDLGHAYVAADSQSAREATVIIADGLLLYFEGTAWILQTLLFLIPGLIFSLLMLRSPVFSPAIAWFGIIITAAGFGFLIPGLGFVLLLLNTAGTIVWYPIVARRLWRAAGAQ